MSILNGNRWVHEARERGAQVHLAQERINMQLLEQRLRSAPAADRALVRPEVVDSRSISTASVNNARLTAAPTVAAQRPPVDTKLAAVTAPVAEPVSVRPADRVATRPASKLDNPSA